MALPKLVKSGGSFYKGYELLVSSAPGEYVLNIVQPTTGAVNSLSVIPDTYGAGDTFKLEHLATTTGPLKFVLAESIYNPGANVATLFDFPAYQNVGGGESFRLTYTNTATQAVAVHVIIEYVGINKTS